MENSLKRKRPPDDQRKDGSAATEPQPQFKKYGNRRSLPEANAIYKFVGVEQGLPEKTRLGDRICTELHYVTVEQ